MPGCIYPRTGAKTLASVKKLKFLRNRGNLKPKWYHFRQVWVENKVRGSFEKRLLVIRKVMIKKGFEIKFSFTNANLVQYTEKGIVCMQAQRFFVEHSVKESKKILGMSQYQTCKWLAWQHQVALNIMISVSC